MLDCVTILFLGQQLLGLQSGIAGVHDHVILEIDDFFQAGRLHGQQVTQPAGHRLEKPDVDDRGGQFDMAHAFAADAAVRHLDAATVADHALVFHAAVLATRAFPVLFRPENPFAEQAVFFGAVRSVIDRFRLFDFAERPAAYVVRTRQADFYRSVIVNSVV